MLYSRTLQSSLGKDLHGMDQDLCTGLRSLPPFFPGVNLEYLVHHLTDCINVTASVLHLTNTPENVYFSLA